MKERWVYECFSSHAIIEGKRVSVGIEEAEQFKFKALYRGFLDETGHVRKDMTPLEKMVVALRDVTTELPYNHEWWAAEISKPDWVRKLEDLFMDDWLRFDITDELKAARQIGERWGYNLTISEKMMDKTVNDAAFRERWNNANLEDACRGLDPEDAAKVRVVIPGNESLEDYAQEALPEIKKLREMVMGLAGKLPLEQSTRFIEGLGVGTAKAKKVDFDNENSEFHERNEIVEILHNSWDVISRMENRTEITHWILEHLPVEKKNFIETSGEQNQRFIDRLRQTYFEPIGLIPAGKGRPKKIGTS